MTDGIIQQVIEPVLKVLSKEPPKYFTFEQRAMREAVIKMLESIQIELIEKVKQLPYSRSVDGREWLDSTTKQDLIGDYK